MNQHELAKAIHTPTPWIWQRMLDAVAFIFGVGSCILFLVG